MKRELPPLLLGLAVGALGATALRHAFPAASSATTRSPDTQSAAAAVPPPPPAPWVAPRVLDAADAAAQVDAWLAGNTATADPAVLRALLPVLPADQFARLAEALLARKGGEARAFFQQVFDVWVERDAAAAARWVGALPDSSTLNGRARRLLREQAGLAWARDDLNAALVWAHALPDAGGEWGAAARIYGQLAERDPQRSLSLARARGDEAFYQQACKRIYDGWSSRDPGAALQNLGDVLLAGGKINLINLSDDIGKWGKQDPDAAMRWVLAHDTGEGSGSFSLFHILGGQDGQAALASALVRASADHPRVDLLSYIANAWTRVDPDAATAWLATVKDADLRAQIVSRAAGSSSGETPWDNIALVLLLPAGASRESSLANRVSAWAKVDPDAALAWLKSHDEPAAAAAVQAQLIGTLARTDRAAALASLEKLAPGQDKRTATRAIAAAWAASSPAEAAAWLATASRSTSEDYNHQDWGAVVSPWFKEDPSTVRDWINAQADPKLREEAGGAWVLQLLNSPLDHAQRAALVVGVKDEARQRQDMLNVGAHWFGDDPEGARAWIEASALPQLTKDAVIHSYYKPKR